jgi:hypothetical protein
MVLTVESGDKAYPLVRAILSTVRVLHRAAPADACEFTFFSSATGGRADVSGRLIDLLRFTLQLGDGVTSTSLRRSLVDWAMRNDNMSEGDKRGALPLVPAGAAPQPIEGNGEGKPGCSGPG